MRAWLAAFVVGLAVLLIGNAIGQRLDYLAGWLSGCIFGWLASKEDGAKKEARS